MILVHKTQVSKETWFKKKSVAMLQTWLNKCIYSPDPMAKVKASPQAAIVMPCRPDTLQGARLLRRELEPIWPCWLLPKVKHWPFSEQRKRGDINQEKKLGITLLVELLCKQLFPCADKKNLRFSWIVVILIFVPQLPDKGLGGKKERGHRHYWGFFVASH